MQSNQLPKFKFLLGSPQRLPWLINFPSSQQFRHLTVEPFHSFINIVLKLHYKFPRLEGAPTAPFALCGCQLKLWQTQVSLKPRSTVLLLPPKKEACAAAASARCCSAHSGHIRCSSSSSNNRSSNINIKWHSHECAYVIAARRAVSLSLSCSPSRLARTLSPFAIHQ